jgi:predicted permease
VLFKMLPVKNPEQLVYLERAGGPPSPNPKGKRYSNLSHSYAYFELLRTQHETLAGVCHYAAFPRVNVVVDGQAEVAYIRRVSGSFFAMLGVNALLGRTITEDDDKIPGGHPVLVISHHYWQKRFAGDPAIVGKSIVVNGHPFTIIGVTPPDFFGVVVGESESLWAPAMMHAQLVPGSSIEDYFNGTVGMVMARLKPEVNEKQASVVLTGILQQSLAAAGGSHLSPETEQSLRRQTIVMTPASQGLSSFREHFSEPLRILMTVVGLTLLIACANVAILLSARATARKQEIAIRLALGAGRSRVIRQLLTESMLLALTGGVLGLLFAWWCSGFLLALVGSGHVPIFLKLALDTRVLSFTAAVSMLAGILFGLAPAWRATGLDLTPALKDSSVSSGAGSRLGLGKTLVVAQVALSMLLLIGAGLFVRSLVKLKNLDVGFDQENVLLVSTDPQMIGYQGRQIADLYQRILERIKTIPGVRSASFSRTDLFSGAHRDGPGGRMSARTQGRVYVRGRLARPEDNISAGSASDTMPLRQVGPEYFETVGMTLLGGRSFTARDNENAPAVAVINESFALSYFGREDPLGQRFSICPTCAEFEIVGVVKDAKHNSLRERVLPMYYVPYLQKPDSLRDTTFQIRAADDPTRIITSVRQTVQEIDAKLPLFDIKTLAKQVDESLVQERLIGTIASFFGLLSLLLAVVGLYGVMVYAVSQRTQEIGLRMALGAQRGIVLQMVLRKGMKLVLLGVGLGLAGSIAVTRIIAGRLFGVTSTDPLTFVGVTLLLLMVALLACFIPARRATNVDPLVALKYD